MEAESIANSSLPLASYERDPNYASQQYTFSLMRSILVGSGGSANVFEVDKDRVIKVFPEDEQGRNDMEREKTIYIKLQRVGCSHHITRLLETWDSGLVLERHTGTLRQTLKKLGHVEPKLALRWSQESCKGLKYLHENGVYHGDLGCQNILLSGDKDIKICDFAGSRVQVGNNWDSDWEDAWISYEVRSQHPDYIGKQPDVESEIFSIGSILFEIWTTRPPYVSEKDVVVRRKFKEREFPVSEIVQPVIREIIECCWMGLYSDVSAICSALEVAEAQISNGYKS
jgi:serine/threonine protein kinase